LSGSDGRPIRTGFPHFSHLAESRAATVLLDRNTPATADLLAFPVSAGPQLCSLCGWASHQLLGQEMSHDADEERWRRALRTSMVGLVLLPGDVGYHDAQRVWNADVDRQPRVITQCPSPKDVATHGVRNREETQ